MARVGRSEPPDRSGAALADSLCPADPEAERYNGSRAWRPSHFLPRARSRLQLEITACRAERLNRIRRADATAEGFDASTSLFNDPIDWFHDLWDQLNFGSGFGWDANPWVWVIEFKTIDCE